MKKNTYWGSLARLALALAAHRAARARPSAELPLRHSQQQQPPIPTRMAAASSAHSCRPACSARPVVCAARRPSHNTPQQRCCCACRSTAHVACTSHCMHPMPEKTVLGLADGPPPSNFACCLSSPGPRFHGPHPMRPGPPVTRRRPNPTKPLLRRRAATRDAPVAGS